METVHPRNQNFEDLKAYSFYLSWACSSEVLSETPTEGLDTFESGNVEKHAFAALVFLMKGGIENYKKAHFHLERVLFLHPNAKDIDPIDMLDISAHFVCKSTLVACLHKKEKEDFYRVCEDFRNGVLDNDKSVAISEKVDFYSSSSLPSSSSSPPHSPSS